MAKKNQQEFGKGGCGKPRSVKYPNNIINSSKCLSGTSPSKGEPRSSPVGAPSSSQGSSPRTSPGLLAGHYAGCKWTEPPLPSALPLPPQHWMQETSATPAILRPFPKHSGEQQFDIAQQLKVLLKVQA